jgi:CheY-like chemotaxis protein
VHPLPAVFIDAVPKYRVLVVDDSMANRKMTSRFLQMSKIAEAITEAEDGLQAVAAVKKSMEQGEKEFNVILMDYVMPEMDGPTATKAIRALGYKGLLVGVTGNLLPEDTELFMSSGATAVMGKPLDMKELKYLLMKSIVASNPSVRSSFSHISSPSACHTPGKGLVPRGTKANHPNRANKDGVAGFGYANEQHSSFCFYQSDDSFLAPVVSRGQSFRGFGAAPQSIQSSFHMGEKSLLMPAMHLSQDLKGIVSDACSVESEMCCPTI